MLGTAAGACVDGRSGGGPVEGRRGGVPGCDADKEVGVPAGFGAEDGAAPVGRGGAPDPYVVEVYVEIV
jgi:hypothetical protein